MYDVFLLVSKEVLRDIKYEPEVQGIACIPAFRLPYPVYSVAICTDNIQPLIDKYKVDAIWEKNGSGEITV